MKIKKIQKTNLNQAYWASFDDLSEGDLAYTFNMITKVKELKPIKKIIKKRESKFIKITSDNYEQFVTWDHNSLMNNMSFKKAKDIVIGDILVGNTVVKNTELLELEEQDVWCINTENGTVYALKDDKEFLTGNCQAPFSNVTLDLIVPNDLKNEHPNIGGKKQPFVYGDLQEEMDLFNKAFFEVFEAGDSLGSIFQYPILTVNITPDFRWDHPITDALFNLDAKYGSFYFTNMINSDLKPEDLRSMCCRLLLDLKQLRKKNGGLFGAAEATGSIGVVTLNLPRIGYLSHTKEEFFQRLDGLMKIAKDSLELKRVVLNKFLEEGLYPYTKRYLKDGFDNHFSTIGIIGMNEMCRNYFRNIKKKDLGIMSKEGENFCIEVLEYMRNKCSDFQEETGSLYNLEAVPGESTCYRLALHDKKKYPDILTAGTVSTPYYTNSTHLPVGYTDDPWVAIPVQEKLQTMLTGGTVFHFFAENNNIPGEKVKELIKKIINNTRLPYVTWSPTIRICNKHGMIFDSMNNDVCPMCLEESKKSYNEKLLNLEEQKFKLLEELKINSPCC
jgi:ribonucleoside-triphosphate reductase